MKIKNKVAIVTGASSGIGLATARILTKHGARVALVARSKNKLIALAKELPNSLAIPADISHSEEIKKMIKKVKSHYGKIDILVNNAGQGYDALVEHIDIATFENVFKLDLVGPLVTMQEVIPIMKKQGNGLIINISSGTALMYLPNMAAYSSLKRALVGISLTAREELKKDNIVVSVVYPYITSTNFEKNTIKYADTHDEADGEEPPHPADPPDYIAQKIKEGIESEDAEIFAHDWMKNL